MDGSRRRGALPLTAVGLVVANLLPLAGVLWWGWSAFELLVVYWLESGIVGALNVPKILLASGEADGTGDDATFQLRINGRPYDTGEDGSTGAAALAGFFVVHYGIFWVVHGAFVFALPLFAGGGMAWYADASLFTVALAAGPLFVSHGLSFLVNYLGSEEFRRVTPSEQMFRPYGRVAVLHGTVLFGAYAVAIVGTPLAALGFLVAIKTALDVLAHLREHGTDAGSQLPLPSL